ncbi:MAG: restriction endonuclease subunit S [Acholeplasmataceae bacterium]
MKAEELRKSILQLAIQGKLVKQDLNDVPASVLLERIKFEKEKLIKEGKIKKDKTDSHIFKGEDGSYYEKIGKTSKCIDDEIPFELPSNWVFVKFKSLFNVGTGVNFKKDFAGKIEKENSVRILRGGNIRPLNYYFFDNDIFLDAKYVKSEELMRENDLITPSVSSLENIGKIAFVDKDYSNVAVGGFVFIWRPYFNLSKFMLYALSSPFFVQQLKGVTKKSGQAFYNCGKERLLELYVPLPPLEEQKRIVAKIEELMPLIDEYEMYETLDSELDKTLEDKLSKSILQYAIQGKLVKQDPNDEPASVLLERIKLEKEKLIKEGKIKKNKTDSHIFKGEDGSYYEKIGKTTRCIDDIIPFELQPGWMWTRLGCLINVVGGTSYNKSDILKEGIRILRGGNIQSNHILLFDDDVFLPDQYLSPEKTLKKNDIVIVGSTGSKNVIGKPGFFFADDDNIQIGAFLRIIRPFLDEISPFLNLIFSSEFYREYVRTMVQGTNIYNVSASHINNFLVPIPPLEEQKRIVSKANKIIFALSKTNL